MRSCVLLALFFLSGSANAGNLAGAWSSSRSGPFSLELVEHGTLICGRVEAISGQRVDFSWVVGARKGSDYLVHFTSSFADAGSHGVAHLHRTGTQLEWRVSQQPTGENWILDNVRLRQQRWEPGRFKLISAWCADKWKKIQEGDLGSLQLVEP